MNFLKTYYDRLIALVAVILVVIGLFVLLFKIRMIKEDFPNLIPSTPPSVKSYDFESVEQLKDSFKNPSVWQTNSHRLFQPPLMRVASDGYPEAAAEGREGVGPVNVQGIPIDWLKRYDLDFRNPNIGNEDTDGDGYTNLEEYLADSNPIDADITPNPANQLRVVSRYRRDFPYKFVAYSESAAGGNRIQLNQENGKTLLVGEGEAFGDGYKIEKLSKRKERRLNKATNREEEVEVTTVTIVDKNGQPIILERGGKVKTNETYAKLIYLRNGKEYEVKMGDKFKVEKTQFTVDKIVPVEKVVPENEKIGIDDGVGLVVVSSVNKVGTTTYDLKSYNAKEDKKGEQIGGAGAEKEKTKRSKPEVPAGRR